MIGAIVSFTSMAVAGRELGGQLDTFEIMMYRSVIGLLIVCALISYTGHWKAVSAARLHSHLGRNLAHFIGQNLWFFAVTAIPLAQVFALEFTSPLWVIILAPFFLGEPLTRVRVLAVSLGFIGILIVARPSPETLTIGTFAAAASAIFFAATTIMTKRLTRTETVACILFWLTLSQAIMGLITAGYDGDITLPDAQSAPWVLVIAIAGLTAHFSITNALAIAPASVVIPIDFVRLPAIAVIGMLYYNEPLDVYVLIGALIIFGGNYLNVASETRKNRVADR
ncbi:MAG: DMT family transporter [Rhodobacteraceae bacterium]|nr:DMT family transporter [Paracoccaceae bacterium]